MKKHTKQGSPSSVLVAKDGRTVEEIRRDFPMTQVLEHGHPLIYFNSGATSLKPVQVLDRMNQYYKEYGVNVARGVDKIGYDATKAYEDVRAQAAHFIGASKPEEIIFTRNTTEALNLIAYAYGGSHISEDDEIIISVNEHHANYVPWQELAKRQGAKLVLVKPDQTGQVTPELLEEKMTEKTRLVALFHVSNVMGATNDLEALAKIVHRQDAVLVVDGAQGIVHHPVDVTKSDVDFYCFSGHKLLGPTGIGILYGKADLLRAMPPWQFGGEMIDVVGDYETTFADIPARFEAGTMPIAEVLGLGEALAYIDRIGYDFIQAQIALLGRRMVEGLEALPNMEIYNASNYKNGVLAYNAKGIHPHDVAGVYDREGISIRAGHHCNQPTMRFLGVQSTLRASVNFYNTLDEVEHFIEVSKKAGDFLDVLF